MAITTINGRTMGTTIKEIPSPDRTFLFTGSVDDLPDKGAEGDMAYCLGGADAGKVFRFSEDVLDWVQVESGGSGGGGGVLYLEDIYDAEAGEHYLADINGNPASYEIVKAAIEGGQSCILRMRSESPDEGTVSYNLLPCDRYTESPNYSDYYAVSVCPPSESYSVLYEATTNTGRLILFDSGI